MINESVHELFSRAEIASLEDDSRPADVASGRAAMACLQRLGSIEVLEAALAACRADTPQRRCVGAGVLGQLGHTEPGYKPVFTEERYLGLTDLLAAEYNGPRNAAVLSEVCVALGHLDDERAVPAVLALSGHPDAGVRFAVAFALGGHKTCEAIDGLIALSSDTDDDVRNWSVFGIAQLIDADTPAIRAALRARLDDPSEEVRNEAIQGLASRSDLSVLSFLIDELRSGVAAPLLEAAIALARPELCEALIASANRGLVLDTGHGPYDLTDTWTDAMRACGCRS